MFGTLPGERMLSGAVVMSFTKMPTLRIGALEVDIPIAQGAMGVGVSLSDLASAVANAGGIGVIATLVGEYVTVVMQRSLEDRMAAQNA
jgi:NAD(P)H-dependent flavin oxidoreductase YrpB (nitropropane dioxygenase family)